MSTETVPMLSAAESRCQLLASNVPSLRVGPLVHVPNRCLHEVFEEQVESHPEKTAIVHGKRRLTFRRFNEMVNQLAWTLRDRGVRERAIVGIYADRSIETVAGMLAVLKVGGTYLPLDPSYPPSRIARAVSAGRPQLILVNRDCSHWPPCLFDCQVMDLRTTAAYARRTDNLGLDIDPQTPFYLIFTSGTTGQPKGVLLTHANMLNLAHHNWRPGGMNFSRAVLQWAPIGFDASANEIFSCLLAGGKLVLIDAKKRLVLKELFRVVREEQVETLLLSALYLRKIFSAESRIQMIPPCVKYVQSTGQRLVLNEAMRHFFSSDQRQLFNEYGPSETHVSNSVRIAPVESFTDNPPIGHVIANSFVCLLDGETGEPVDDGERGEIYIGGACVGPGYHRNPTLTEERFRSVELGGRRYRMYRTGDFGRWTDQGLEFLGRIANQYKSNGNLVLVEDVERAFQELDVIDQVKVVVTSENSAVAYVVCVDEHTSGADLRNMLDVDEYAKPQEIFFVESFPSGVTDKTDVERLAEIATSESALRQPTRPLTSREQDVANLLSDTLGTENVGAEDTLRGLAGDSLDLMDVILGFQAAFGVTLPPDVGSEYTVAELAAYSLNPTPPIPSRQEVQQSARLDEPFAIEVVLASSHARSSGDDILLTGATGHLGIHLLRALVEQTDRSVLCVVRGHSVAEATRRLNAAVRRSRLGQLADWKRVSVIRGDVTLDRLGQTATDYFALAERVGTVFHAAAEVDFLKPFTALKAPNVDGVKRIVQFARDGRPKDVHHMSSTSVADVLAEPGGLVAEDPISKFTAVEAMPHGYSASKWAAELALESAREWGMTAQVYRLCRLTDPVREGEVGRANFHDAFLLFAKSCQQIGRIPDLRIEDYWYPVDMAADAVVRLALASRRTRSTYHIVGSRAVTIDDVVRVFGGTYRVVPAEAWCEQIRTSPIASDVAQMVAAYWDVFQNDLQNRGFASRQTQRALSRLGVALPPVPQQLLPQYLSSWQNHDPGFARLRRADVG